MIQKIVIAYESDVEISKELRGLLERIEAQEEMSVELIGYRTILEDASQETLALLYLDDAKIKYFLNNHIDSRIKIGFLPNKGSFRAMRSYGVSKDIHKAFSEALEEENESEVDVLLCNGEIVFTNVVIGDVYGLSYRNVESQTLLEKLKNFYKNLKNLKFNDYTITTAKERVIQTAATGVMVLEHNSRLGKYNIINEELSLNDGKLDAFIISPTSILSHIYYLLIVTFYGKLHRKTFPQTLGFIKTSKLEIESGKPMDFTVDGVMMSAQAIAFELKQEALTLRLGAYLAKSMRKSTKSKESKEVVKAKYLPRDEERRLLLSEPIPLFQRADEEAFKGLFLTLKENAKPSSVFVVLMVLSTLLATTGLFQSSAPVIIGAMILAPLMSPIISLSMGVVRGEGFFIVSSMKTLALGVLTALFFSSTYAMLLPLNVLTDEMHGRLNPTLLDLMVAIISGMAGAYANAKSEIAKSLAGVAIAVALVPPLSVTGIGLGWGDFSIAYGSFLLFLTNLIGITLAAAVTFLVLGYSPIRRAKKGIVYASVILAIVTVPLVISFSKAIEQSRIVTKLNNRVCVENGKTVTVNVLHVDLNREKPEIYLQTKSSEVLSTKDLSALKRDIETRLQESVVLNISASTIIE